MATVYLAHDVKHNRSIALKVLHPELAASLGPERFLREIEVTARLDHPHILPVLDSGNAAGLLWYTMPYVEGETLRDRLRREPQLPVHEALRIAQEVADSLDYAHRHRVIHRDIKPENILLADNHARVADFGIARALEVAGGEVITATGLAVGTPAYMSPEQAAGDREIDRRSDIYSLGSVLYEMLAGEPPFTGPTPQAVIAKRFAEPVPHLRTMRETVPPEVEQAVTTALAKAPADRFATAAEFARALADVPKISSLVSTLERQPGVATARPRGKHRTPIAAAMLGLGFMIGLGVLFGWLRGHRGANEDGGKVLAVLPFENRGAIQDEYFAEGLTDALRGKLASVPGVQVIARGSSAPYKKTTKPPDQIARELGARYLLTGTVRWEKRQGGVSRVLVSPELVEVPNRSRPKTRWQQPFDAGMTDVFQVQADIAGRVAEALGVALGSMERKELAERPTRNLAAYDAYLQGNQFDVLAASAEELRRTIRHYEQAVALDSSFAVAWAQLSRAHSRLYAISAPLPADAERAQQAANRARALSPDLADTYLALGFYHDAVRKDPTGALEQYALGLRGAPNNPELLVATALIQEQRGRWGEGYASLRKAQALDPRSVSIAWRLAYTLLWLRRYPEALQASNRGLALAPTNLNLLEAKAMIYLAQGDLAGARAVLAAAPREVEPTALIAYVALYWDLFWVLDDEDQRLLLRLRPSAFDNDRGAWGLVLAQTYAHRGDQARARIYGDSARLGYAEQLKGTPADAQAHVLHGLALAYLGRKSEAVKEGQRGLALQPITQNAYAGAYNQHQLVRIYILVGDRERALDKLEPLLKMPYYLSPGWLRIDPNFTPLRGNPRFQSLLNGQG
jgi:eukaryotic-like serine/threonine-protein kinase